MRSTGAIIIVVILLIVGIGGCAGVGSYNRMVGLDENVERSWSDVQNQYQRRSDLIGNLVNTVKGAADFERETLEAVTNARARATSMNINASDLDDPAKLQQFQEAQGELGRSLGRLLVVAENYPQLRATDSFRELQVQLEGTENRIAVARRDFNGSVQGYNTAVRSFPTNIMAGMLGFERRAAFEADPGAERAPTVEF